MSDQGSSGWDDRTGSWEPQGGGSVPPPGPGGPGGPPPPGPPPPGPQPYEQYGYQQYQQPYAPPPPERSRVRGPLLIALIVGALGIVGGAVFALTQGGGAANSPEGAAEKLLNAVEKEDFIGVLEALPPSERDTFLQPIQDIVKELKRLGILAENTNLGKISGIDLDFSGLKFSSTVINDRLSLVRVEEGTLKTTVTPSKLPAGSLIRDIAGDEIDQAEVETTEEDAGDDATFVALKEGRDWYISLWYSVAEAARGGSGADLPDPSERIEAKGAQSAEAAVDQMLRALVRLDLRRIIELLPPDEARALHDYAPLFIDDAEEAAADARREFTFTFRTLDLDAKESGDRALVQVKKLAVEITVPGEDVRIVHADGCTTVSPIRGRGTPERFCQSDGGLFGAIPGTEDFDIPALDLERPELGFVTVRRDGLWYVSPTRTFFDNITATLRAFDRDDIDALREYFEGLD